VTTAEGAGPRHFFFHPTLSVVYFVNEKNSSVTAYRLNSETGKLETLQSISTLPDTFAERASNTCADIEITPCGRFLYASNRGHDSLAGYAVDPESGRLTMLGTFATEQTPRSFNIHPNGRFLLSAGQGNGRLATYRIDNDSGKLIPLETFEVGPDPAWIQVVTRPESP
jgi:6-phosphogluconolactonase